MSPEPSLAGMARRAHLSLLPLGDGRGIGDAQAALRTRDPGVIRAAASRLFAGNAEGTIDAPTRRAVAEVLSVAALIAEVGTHVEAMPV